MMKTVKTFCLVALFAFNSVNGRPQRVQQQRAISNSGFTTATPRPDSVNGQSRVRPQHHPRQGNNTSDFISDIASASITIDAGQSSTIASDLPSPSVDESNPSITGASGGVGGDDPDCTAKDFAHFFGGWGGQHTKGTKGSGKTGHGGGGKTSSEDGLTSTSAALGLESSSAMGNPSSTTGLVESSSGVGLESSAAADISSANAAPSPDLNQRRRRNVL